MMKNNQLFQQVESSRGQGGRRQGAGRKAGVPNKINRDIKAMIEGALEKAGGESYLLEQAMNNPQAFMSLLGKIIPRDMKVELSGAVDLANRVKEARERAGK